MPTLGNVSLLLCIPDLQAREEENDDTFSAPPPLTYHTTSRARWKSEVLGGEQNVGQFLIMIFVA